MIKNVILHRVLLKQASANFIYENYEAETMSKDQTGDLIKFLEAFDSEIRDIVLWLREFVWDLYPSANELIYDNYNALAFGWSPTDKVGLTFCTTAVGRTNKNIHFGFYWGSKISDPDNKLLRKGKQYRYILVKNKHEFPEDYIKNLLAEAYEYSNLKPWLKTWA